MKKVICYCFVVLILEYLPHNVEGSEDNLRFSNLSVEQGLSQSTVNTILQDRTGYLWFGTQDGLNKYDGFTFTIYRHDASDSTSISDNWISSIFEDSKGVMWICTYSGGLNRYDPENECFIRYRHESGKPSSISGNNVTSIVEETSSVYWVGVWGGGLNKFVEGRNAFQSYRAADVSNIHIPSDNVRCLLKDKNGFLWVGTWDGLAVIDLKNMNSRVYKHDSTDPNSLSDNKIISLYEDQDGTIWVSTFTEGLCRYNASEDNFVRYRFDSTNKNGLSSNQVSGVVQDKTGRHWIATRGGGVNILDIKSGLFSAYRHQSSLPGSLSNDLVFSIYCDRSDRIWIGTDGGGIDLYDHLKFQFHHYRYSDGGKSSLSHPMVRSIVEDKMGVLWVGTYGGGLNRYSTTQNVYTYYHHDPSNLKSITHNGILALLEDSKGKVWIGTDGGGLDLFDREHNLFIHHRHNPNDSTTISSNFIISLCRDQNNGIWVGTAGGGLNRYDPERKIFSHYRRTGNKENEISGNYIWSMYQDRKGYLWIGTWGAGLNRFDPSNGTFTVYRHNQSDQNSLGNNTVFSIYEDDEGNLWIGTSGGGLDCLDLNENKFIHFTEKAGLPNNYVYAILPDDSGNLWLSTNRGISCFNSEKKTFHNYDMNDGLQSNEFNQGAYFKNSFGKLYFGGVNGVSAFIPESLRVNTSVPTVVITKFRIFDNAYKTSSFTKPLVLSYNDNYFSFEFAVLDYTAPQKNRYMYKLEGFDKDWIQSATRRYAAYTNLDGGEYIFRVKGCNNDGIWNEEGASLRIIILPPYWKTMWFRIAAILSILTVTFIIYRRRISVLQKEKRYQQEYSRKLLEFQDNERKRIANELHDSLGQNLQLIKNGLQQCEGMIESKESVGEELQQLSEVASQAIDEVREISYDLHPHTLDRLGLKKGIESVINKFSQTSSIRFSFVIDDIDKYFSTRDDIHIFRIIQECLTNVMKHSEATDCNLQIRRQDGIVRIIVKDNGKGFANQRYLLNPSSHNGLGLTGIQERVRLLNGTLSIDFDKGIRVTVDIPLREKR